MPGRLCGSTDVAPPTAVRPPRQRRVVAPRQRSDRPQRPAVRSPRHARPAPRLRHRYIVVDVMFQVMVSFLMGPTTVRSKLLVAVFHT